MAILYISNQATNGYIVGDNGNDGSTKLLAKLTFAGALSAASSGDTIVINDGTYDNASYYTINKSNLTVNTENDYLTILTSTDTTRVIHQDDLGTGLTLGKVIVDGEGNTSKCITTDSGTNVENLTLNETDLRGFTGAALESTRLVNLVATSPRLTTTGSSRIMNLTAPAVVSSYVIDSPVFNCSGITSSGILVTGNAAGTTYKIYGTTGSFAATFKTFPAILSEGCSEFHAYNNGALSIPAGSGISCKNNANPCDAYVYDNDGLAGGGLTNSYYGIIVGEDSVATNANSITVKRYDNNHVSGFDHLQSFGYITGARGSNTSSDDGYVGHLIKQCTDCWFTGALSTRCTNVYLQLKAATNCHIANSAYIISSGYDGTGVLANADGTNCATSGFSNINGVTEIDTSALVNIAALQDVAVKNHNHDAEVSFSGDIYFNGASAYDSASAANADPLFSGLSEFDSGYTDKDNGDYSLLSTSDLVSAGVQWWGLAARPSTAGEPVPDRGIDVGHIQSTHYAFHPASL